MGPEIGHLNGPELPVEHEKLETLWRKSWAFIKKEVDHPTAERIMFIKEGRLVEIESSWDSDNLDGISIKSWATGQSLLIQPRILPYEARVFVRSPGFVNMKGESVERWRFEEKVTPEWVESITFSLMQLLGEI